MSHDSHDSHGNHGHSAAPIPGADSPGGWPLALLLGIATLAVSLYALLAPR
jgi:hypothetical protein